MPTPRSVLTHPVVWSIPVMALLAWISMPINDELYEFWVNYDPQGDAQQQESLHATRIFRYTSGVLGGQLLALLAGAALARRHSQATALAVAAPLGVLLAGVTVLVAYPLARAREAGHRVGPAYDDPVLVRVLLHELAGYPLLAAAGVGLGILLAGRRTSQRGALLILLGLIWYAAMQVGLAQDDEFGGPSWLLWAVPPIAAGTAVALAGLALDVWSDPPLLVGDGGSSAGIALLVGAGAYALGLNLLGVLVGRRRRRPTRTPPPESAADS
ncbi:hypothetical protein E0H26_08450 [Micromonospora zingiberis]|uniref:Uncharacterized protein n=1 Tax=Micromonospora zingiberis TaxID=2053011 RepID=A0A4R0GL86_9ACTN|nr:hypothetical protein [Micromonospora zingiberis]TCB98404.1 hypothetical protein E0H26_08450 [Micromonospora zingiberis]